MGDRASAGRIGNHAFFLLIVVVVGDVVVVSSVSTVERKTGDVLDGDDVLMVMAAELNDWKDAAGDNNKSSCNIIGIIILTWRRRVILFIAAVWFDRSIPIVIFTTTIIVTHKGLV